VLDDEELAFMREYASSICYTHVIAAVALYRAASEAESVAIDAEGLLRDGVLEDARARAEEDRTDALVQTHVVARLLAQLAAAIEDCGALGDAVRHRHRAGWLFRRYLHSQGGSVGDFWDAVLVPTSLPALLRLPELDSITIPDSDHASIELDYEQLALALGDVAGIYRGRSTPGTWSADGSPAVNEVVHIVFDVVPAGSAVASAGSVTILQAYNKLKRRFAVFDHVTPLAQAVAKKRGCGDRYHISAGPRLRSAPPHQHRESGKGCRRDRRASAAAR
jgi:hypothetical protein